jgi:putative ABC transport system permease protein
MRLKMPGGLDRIALKMLIGDRAKYLTVVAGVTFSVFLIVQMVSVFIGILRRTTADIRTIGAQVWVTDPALKYIDDIQPLSNSALVRVRSVHGVEWAVPLFIGNLRARLPNGVFQSVRLIGLDSSSLVGRPGRILKGRLEDIYQSNAVLVNERGLRKLGFPSIGDIFEINDRQARIVGIVDVETGLFDLPMLFTTFEKATEFSPPERKLLSFILVKPKQEASVQILKKEIEERTGLLALTNEEISWKTIKYYLTQTGIGMNFSIITLLGFLVGAAVTGQTFHAFALENLKQFAALKAMGVTRLTLIRMVLIQSLVVGIQGYGLGVGAASLLLYVLTKKLPNYAAFTPPHVLIGSFVMTLFICGIAAGVVLSRIIRLEPATVFRG